METDKELLLKDLCARLPYRVKVHTSSKPICTIFSKPTISSTVVIDGAGEEVCNISDIKPYLFPLSSMTEEQKIDLTKYLDARVFVVNGEISFSCLYANTMDRWKKVFEWCLMKLWICRRRDDVLALHLKEPKYNQFSEDWISGALLTRKIERTDFPSVTFENSPQQVEIKLIENGLPNNSPK